ncbi:hypothetical protein FNF28_07406 [Cafeteria roenbergensis]|uniref:Uncharacterized protein n=1 Tax=Cafeteria roenbergensis TaxID=33653 RepID=A0A5A8C7P3_CAFRO|nr:hypothetical protein FNF28_07406 [Cafeteria roenbergensis]
MATVVVLGAAGTGKSSLVASLCGGAVPRAYSPTRAPLETATVFVDEADPSLSVDAVVIDGAGAASDPPLPGSRAPSPELVKLLWGSQAVIITYDVTRRSTFEAAITYLLEGVRHAAPEAFTLLLGTHTDLESERRVSPDEAEDATGRLSAAYFEASPRTGEHIGLVRTLLRVRLRQMAEASQADASPVEAGQDQGQGQGGDIDRARAEHDHDHDHDHEADAQAESAFREDPSRSWQPVQAPRQEGLRGPQRGDADGYSDVEEAEWGPDRADHAGRLTPERPAWDHPGQAGLSGFTDGGADTPPRAVADVSLSEPKQSFRIPSASAASGSGQGRDHGPTPSGRGAGNGRALAPSEDEGMGGGMSLLWEAEPSLSGVTGDDGDDDGSLDGAGRDAVRVGVALGRSQGSLSRVDDYEQALREYEAELGAGGGLSRPSQQPGSGHQAWDADSDGEGGAVTLGAMLQQGTLASARELLFVVDVNVGGEVVGQLPVRRSTKPLSLATRFVAEQGLGSDLTVKLTKVIENRLRAFLDDESKRLAAAKRRGVRRQVEAFRHRATEPKPFTFASERLARERRSGGGAKPVVGRLRVRVRSMGRAQQGTLVLRLGDRAEDVVERFRRTYGLDPDEVQTLVAAVARRLEEAEAKDEERRREAARQASKAAGSRRGSPSDPTASEARAPPRDSEIGRPVILRIDLEYEEDQWAAIDVREGDNVQHLAQDFCRECGLEPDMVPEVVATIVERLQAHQAATASQ